MTKDINSNSRGFTIVELLIVIVVIAILAAISIVAYNGITQRANVSAAESTAATMEKKIEAYNSIRSAYPTATTVANYTSALASESESDISGSGITIQGGNPNATNGKNTVRINVCTTSGVTGYQIVHWDYESGGVIGTPIQATDGTCATWTPLT